MISQQSKFLAKKGSSSSITDNQLFNQFFGIEQQNELLLK